MTCCWNLQYNFLLPQVFTSIFTKWFLNAQSFIGGLSIYLDSAYSLINELLPLFLQTRKLTEQDHQLDWRLTSEFRARQTRWRQEQQKVKTSQVCLSQPTLTLTLFVKTTENQLQTNLFSKLYNPLELLMKLNCLLL